VPRPIEHNKNQVDGKLPLACPTGKTPDRLVLRDFGSEEAREVAQNAQNNVRANSHFEQSQGATQCPVPCRKNILFPSVNQ
jgi:hypothetical protein